MSFYLKFNESITWFIPGEKQWIVHASRRRGYFTLFQSFNKIVPGSHILQGTVTHNEVRRLEISPGKYNLSKTFIMYLTLLFSTTLTRCHKFLLE